MKNTLGVKQLKIIDELVDHFVKKRHLFSTTLNSINGSIDNSASLNKLIHSKKYRVKDPEHLRDKLIRKAIDMKKAGIPFDINKDNLFSKVNDLAGFRILHLYTRQIEQIDMELKKIFREQAWILIEGPNAKTWDDESRSYFKEIGIKTSKHPNMYTSVHYIIQPNSSASITCEIQVRTLMEEVWGEVDHSINYPLKNDSNSCRDQIKVLARMTSSCSRLVDCIFSTHKEYESNKLLLPRSKKVSAKR